MDGIVQDIEDLATRNEACRQVIYTTTSCQLVMMALTSQEEIGDEHHGLCSAPHRRV